MFYDLYLLLLSNYVVFLQILSNITNDHKLLLINLYDNKYWRLKAVLILY